MKGGRWADEAEESSGDEGDTPLSPTTAPTAGAAGGLAIPPTHSTKPDSKGIKIVTSYRANPANASTLFKTTTRIKIIRDRTRENRAVEQRRKWKPFGQAALDEDQSNVTIQSRDDVYLEDPNADTDMQDEDPAKALAGNLSAFWEKTKRRHLERKYDVDGTDVAAVAGAGGEAEDGWTQVKGGGGGGKNVYVPPGARGGGAGPAGGGKSLAAMDAAMGGEAGAQSRRFDDRDQNTIRVTNISEDTTESDLQELFQPFGRISRVYLAKDKETLISRGFAFVSFVHREDAQRAMEKLQGFGYDHLILKLEWAKPSAPRDPGTEGTQFRSGYGKALAQDTKEKVSFASNLTRNR